MRFFHSLAVCALALAVSGAVYAQPANPGAGSGVPPNSPEAPMPGAVAPPDTSNLSMPAYMYLNTPYGPSAVTAGGLNGGANSSFGRP
jgi:hypothetical protein